MKKDGMFKAYIVVSDEDGLPLGYPRSIGSAAAYRTKYGKPEDDILKFEAGLLTKVDVESEDDEQSLVLETLQRMIAQQQKQLEVYEQLLNLERLKNRDC